MLGFFGLQATRLATALFAGALLVIAIILGALYLWSPHATIRITTGPAGGMAESFISALIATATAHHPRIRFETVPAPDLRSAAMALEEGRVDIALVRSDVAPPVNGETLVIIRRDAVAIVLPPGSPIRGVTQLSGKAVAIPTSHMQEDNSRALDLILSYFDMPPDAVKRVFLPISEIGAALREKRAAAALSVGPIGPGHAVEVVSAIAKATHGAPEILSLDEGEAISKRFPGLETIDIPEGAFRARPPTPGDDVKSLAVTYRLVAPATMLDVVAGAIARAILRAKARLMAVTPLANGIEAPDPDDKNPVLPIHPGVAAYLSSGDQSFLDEAQKYLYAIGIPLSLLGSTVAVVAGFLRGRRLQDDQQRVFRLLVIAEEVGSASAEELALLERELKSILVACLRKLIDGSSGADQASVSMAVEHARRAIDERKAELRGGEIKPARRSDRVTETPGAGTGP